MGDHSSVEGDIAVKNTIKSQERRNGASNNGTCLLLGPKGKNLFYGVVIVRVFSELTEFLTLLNLN